MTIAGVDRRELLRIGLGVLGTLSLTGPSRAAGECKARFLDALDPGRLGENVQPYDLAKLHGALTPNGEFFVRSHFGTPLIRDHRLEIRGRVDRPGVWTMDRLRALPRREAIVTLECAGNSSAQRQGLVGTARFGGTSLAALLDEIRPSHKEDTLVFRGADRPFDGATETYARSMAVTEALGRGALLVWEMNGAPLSPDHGAPLRLVVPGWYGMASVKWLTTIELASEPLVGRFQTDLYVNRSTGTGGERRLLPVGRLELKSVVAAVESRGSVLRLHGAAWGAEIIQRVAVTFDLGKSWIDAVLEPETAPAAWRLWRLDWRPPQSGKYSVASRAFGSNEAQPLFRAKELAEAPYARNEVVARPLAVECR